MSELLFIDACVRGERSRTKKLAGRFLDAFQAANPAYTVTRRDLCSDRLPPQYPEVLAERDALWNAGRLEHPIFAPAHQFAAASRIVIAAPFWDLSFPAILKIYLERISVTDITFGYNAQGDMIGLCRAERMLLITTRGGDFSSEELNWMEMGTKQLKALCAMYGIPRFDCLAAEGLDDVRRDGSAILEQAMRQAETLAASFG